MVEYEGEGSMREGEYEGGGRGSEKPFPLGPHYLWQMGDLV